MRPIEAFDWALRFEARVRESLLAGDDAPLIDYENLGADAMLSVPDREHYFPLLYVIATRRPGDRVSFPVDGIDGGSVSMLTARIEKTITIARRRRDVLRGDARHSKPPTKPPVEEF